VLIVAAVELRHPMVFIIQVKPHDMTREAFHIASARTRCLRAAVNTPFTNGTGTSCSATKNDAQGGNDASSRQREAAETQQ
jgi:hypothetical protein